ncbi:MAG: hypothetical protein ACR2KH_03670 [Sphingomicrobium sp.]
MTASAFRSRGVMAAAATAIASSILGFIVLVLSGQLDLAAMRDPATELPVIAAIVLFWVPAFAFVPAAILGWFVERPKAATMIARRSGGLIPHLALSVVAAMLLWLLFRSALYVTNSTPQFMDAPSLVLLGLVGVCSGTAWWLMVVEPGRRE